MPGRAQLKPSLSRGQSAKSLYGSGKWAAPMVRNLALAPYTVAMLSLARLAPAFSPPERLSQHSGSIPSSKIELNSEPGEMQELCS